MNLKLGLPILAALLAALFVAAPSSAAVVDGGPSGSAAKKKKAKSCKHKRGKAKRKCRKRQAEQGPSKPPVASVISGLTCPTGTVSGAVPATISGIATPPGEPVIIEYRHWTGTRFVDHSGNPAPDGAFFDSVTPNPTTGAWSFSFTPNRGPWNPANGVWAETVRVTYSGGEAATATQTCSWQVSA